MQLPGNNAVILLAALEPDCIRHEGRPVIFWWVAEKQLLASGFSATNISNFFLWGPSVYYGTRPDQLVELPKGPGPATMVSANLHCFCLEALEDTVGMTRREAQALLASGFKKNSNPELKAAL